MNVNRAINRHYARVQKDMEGEPLTRVMEAGTQAMQAVIEEYMRKLGSAGKA